MQLLAHPLRLEGILVAIKWFKQLQRPAHQRIVRKHAAESDKALVRVDSNESMHAVFRTQFVAPPALGCSAAESGAGDAGNFHAVGHDAERRETQKLILDRARRPTRAYPV